MGEAEPRSVSGRGARRLRHSHLATSRSTAVSTAALMVRLFSRAWRRRRSCRPSDIFLTCKLAI